MIDNKERTALNPSVAAEGEQPLTNHNANIADGAANVNTHTVNSDKGEKPKLKTVSMTDLYNQVYTSRPPIINGLLYPGTYILAGAPKLGKSFLMAQLAYHVSTGTDMWGFQVQKGSVLYLALEDDYGRLQMRLYKMFGVDTAKNLYLGIEAPSLGTGLIDLLEGFVEDPPDTRLIIVDTLQKVRGNNDGHTYSSDYQDICQLKPNIAPRGAKCIKLVVLGNERYKGEAILPKSFCTDFLTKKTKKNEGELPQYHVRDSHPAIVTSELWDLVQLEIGRRKALGKHYSGGGAFASRVVCGECGGFYGPKVWHSTDPYRTVIWRCNGKYSTSESKRELCRCPISARMN